MALTTITYVRLQLLENNATCRDSYIEFKILYYGSYEINFSVFQVTVPLPLKSSFCL